MLRTGYQPYETAEVIQEIWSDYSKVNTCQVCGMDDLPCLTLGPTICVWCSERSNLEHHLRFNGTRNRISEKNQDQKTMRLIIIGLSLWALVVVLVAALCVR